jgi:hypothetical protein
LVDVRYLAGNPWQAVTDPIIVERVDALKIDRALPADLCCRIRVFIDSRFEAADANYWRIVRVVRLMGGDSGLRREEFTRAFRKNLTLRWGRRGDHLATECDRQMEQTTNRARQSCHHECVAGTLAGSRSGPRHGDRRPASRTTLHSLDWKSEEKTR